MERQRNEIWFEHAKRAPRSVKFVPYRKGLHAAGGVWGEDDWFEFMDPDAQTAIEAVKAKIEDYVKHGFRIVKTKFISKALAEALGFAYAEPRAPKKTAATPRARKSSRT